MNTVSVLSDDCNTKRHEPTVTSSESETETSEKQKASIEQLESVRSSQSQTQVLGVTCTSRQHKVK